MAAVNLSSLSKGEFKEFIDSFDTVLADCDGVLWLGNIVIPGSPHAITELAKLGKNVFYVTNNSTKSQEEYVSKFTNLGYPATKENILSTAYLAACYLQDLGFKKKVYVVGAKGITQELDAVGIKHLDVGPDPLDSDMNTLLAKEVHLDSEVGAVVVGFDEHISFPKMVKAASYLKQPDCIFVATNTDETFPTEFPLTVPGAGTFVKAIETCSRRTAFKIGKPSTYIGDAVVKKHKVNPKRTLMIGDKCSTDIVFGNNCGFQTLLVLTGVNTLDDVNQLKKSNSEGDKAMVPDYYVNKLDDIVSLML